MSSLLLERVRSHSSAGCSRNSRGRVVLLSACAAPRGGAGFSGLPRVGRRATNKAKDLEAGIGAAPPKAGLIADVQASSSSSSSQQQKKHTAAADPPPLGGYCELDDATETCFIAETLLPTRHGNFRLRGYKHSVRRCWAGRCARGRGGDPCSPALHGASTTQRKPTVP